MLEGMILGIILFPIVLLLDCFFGPYAALSRESDRYNREYCRRLGIPYISTEESVKMSKVWKKNRLKAQKAQASDSPVPRSG